MLESRKKNSLGKIMFFLVLGVLAVILALSREFFIQAFQRNVTNLALSKCEFANRHILVQKSYLDLASENACADNFSQILSNHQLDSSACSILQNYSSLLLTYGRNAALVTDVLEKSGCDSPFAKLNLGWTAWLSGEKSKAVQFWQGDEQEISLYFYFLGNNYRNDGKLDQAVTCLKIAIMINPGAASLDSYTTLAQLYSANNQPNEAIDILQQLLQLDSSNWRARFNLGRQAEMAGNTTLAAEQYSILNNLLGVPEFIRLVAQGRAAYLAGDYQEAAKIFQSTYNVLPGEDFQEFQSLPTLYLSETYYKQGRYPEARDVLLTAVQKYPQDQYTFWSSLGRIAVYEKDWPTAEQAYSQCTALKPSVADNYVSLANAELQQNKIDQSMRDAQLALKYSADLPAAVLILAQANEAKSDYCQARSFYKKYQAALKNPPAWVDQKLTQMPECQNP